MLSNVFFAHADLESAGGESVGTDSIFTLTCIFPFFSQHLNFHFLFSRLLSLLLSQCLNLHSKEVTCSFLVHTPTHVCCNFVNISQWDLFANISCRYLYLHWDHQNLWFDHFDLCQYFNTLSISSSSRERIIEGGRKTPRQANALQVHICD